MIWVVLFVIGVFIAGFLSTKTIRQLTGDPRVDIRTAAELREDEKF